MIEKWALLAILFAVLIAVVGYLVGAKMAGGKKSSQPPTLQQTTLRAQAASAAMDPEPALPVHTSAMPELLLQLLTLKPGRAAPFAAQSNGQVTVAGTVQKQAGDNDKWVVSLRGGKDMYFDSWSTLATTLTSIANGSSAFDMQLNGYGVRVASDLPKREMEGNKPTSFFQNSTNYTVAQF